MNDSNGSINIYSLSYCCISKESRKENKGSKQSKHNFLLSIGQFVCESYLFYALYICRFMKSKNQQHRVMYE